MLLVRKVLPFFTFITAGGLTRCIAVLIVLDTCSSITDLSPGMILIASSSSIVSSALTRALDTPGAEVMRFG